MFYANHIYTWCFWKNGLSEASGKFKRNRGRAYECLPDRPAWTGYSFLLSSVPWKSGQSEGNGDAWTDRSLVFSKMQRILSGNRGWRGTGICIWIYLPLYAGQYVSSLYCKIHGEDRGEAWWDRNGVGSLSDGKIGEESVSF